MSFLNKIFQWRKNQSGASIFGTVANKLLSPVPIMPLAFFRVVYGAILVCFAFQYFYYGRIFRLYIEPELLFPMLPWIPRLPGLWMYLPFTGLLLGAVGILLGWRFRFNAWLFCVSWLYIFVIDVSTYNNHYYLMFLLAILLAVTGSHRWLSVDARRAQALKSEVIPYWQLFLFQFQVFILYFYGGIAKLHPKWIDGTIMTSLMSGLGEHPILWFLASPTIVFFWTYMGLAFDLFVGFFLFWKPTRKWALVGCVVFHLVNEFVLFSSQVTQSTIGMFPMMGLAMCLFFVDREMFLSFFLRGRDVLDRLLRQMGVETRVAKFSVRDFAVQKRSYGKSDRWVLTFVGLYMGIQVLLPFRAYMFPDSLWTREGFLFAWNMKMSTYSKRNFIQFTVNDGLSGFSWNVDVREHLTYLQYQKMCHSPYMAWLYAQYLSDLYAQDKDLQYAWKLRRMTTLPDPQVYVTKSGVSLHSFTTQPLFSPDVDLAHVTYSYWRHNEWILLRK